MRGQCINKPHQICLSKHEVIANTYGMRLKKNVLSASKSSRQNKKLGSITNPGYKQAERN